MPKTIGGSVGFGCTNQRTDVMVVQYLLNCVPTHQGGPTMELKVNGVVDAQTTQAIGRFQAWRRLKTAYGRAEINGQTLAELRRFDPYPQEPFSPAGMKTSGKGSEWEGSSTGYGGKSGHGGKGSGEGGGSASDGGKTGYGGKGGYGGKSSREGAWSAGDGGKAGYGGKSGSGGKASGEGGGSAGDGGKAGYGGKRVSTVVHKPNPHSIFGVQASSGGSNAKTSTGDSAGGKSSGNEGGSSGGGGKTG